MAKKFSELALLDLQSFSDNDILASTDVSDILSRRLTFGDLKSYVASDLFTDELLTPAQVIEAMNADYAANVNLEDGTYIDPEYVGLNSATLDGQRGTFYLDYDNFQNTPVVPTELGQLDNTSGYLTFNETLERIEYRQIINGVDEGALTFTADFVPEGQTNEYFTDAKVRLVLDQELEARLSQILSVFYDGSINDNLIKCSAQLVEFQAGGTQSDQLDFVEHPEQFNDGQTIRIFGANVDNSQLQDLDKDFAIIQVSANGFPTSGPTNHLIKYKVAEMDLLNGNISTASTDVAVSMGSRVLGDGNEDQRPILDQMDSDNNITIRFSGTNPDKALLLYRSVTVNGNDDYKLYAVLGSKDIQNGIYADYGTFDYVSWGPKSEVDNTFTSMIHVPLAPPTTPKRGWADVTIIQADVSGRRIRFSPPLYGEPNVNVNISHNDTAVIQAAVDNFNLTERSALTLNDKIYASSTIYLPQNFTIRGTPGISKIVKIPWSSHLANQTNPTNAIFVPKDTAASNIQIQDVMIDGASEYQVNLLDNAAPGSNYTINFGFDSDTCTNVNVKMNNIIGGGLFTERATDLRVNLCEFKDSGTTDRYTYSPIRATESTNLMITNSRLSNFSDSLDASVSARGLITNNVVSNCGSGILVYGSTFLITNPNVILGPSNEVLQSADALNSVFDSVNIRLQEGQGYESDVYRYQENGIDYDLTAQNGELTFLLYLLEKNSEGTENLYFEINGPNGQDATTYFAPVYDINIRGDEGLFKFKITEQNVTNLLNTYEYDTLKQTNPDHVGVVYVTNLRTDHFAGDIVEGTDGDNVYTYVVTLENYENVAVGDLVYILGHQNFDLGPADPEPSNVAEIIDVLEDTASNQLQITIQYDDTAIVSPGTPNTGKVYMYKNKTIVKGRVL